MLIGRKNKVAERGITHRWLYRGRKMEVDLHTYKEQNEQYIEVCNGKVIVRVFDDGQVVVEQIKKPRK